MTIDVGTTHDPTRQLLPPPALRRQLRLFADNTQEEVAAMFGVTDGAVSRWERVRPSRRYLRAYLELLARWAAEARASGIPVGWHSTQTGDPQK